MNLKSRKGFTLVELIIVIAILGIIALIAVPSLTGVQKRSQVNADIRTAEQIGKAVRVWLTDANINEAKIRETHIKVTAEGATTPVAYKELSSLATVAGTDGLGDYISLSYEPNVSNSDGTANAFYVGLVNDKVVVMIYTAEETPYLGDGVAIYELDDSDDIVKGYAYVEGISALEETNVETALGVTIGE